MFFFRKHRLSFPRPDHYLVFNCDASDSDIVSVFSQIYEIEDEKIVYLVRKMLPDKETRYLITKRNT